MDYKTQKFKLVVSLCLLKSEQDRIKDILSSYNTRLEHIYNNICSLLDELEKLNNLENMTDEQQQLNNLILYANNRHIVSKLCFPLST